MTLIEKLNGCEHAITYDEAVALHTVHAARLLSEDHLRGTDRCDRRGVRSRLLLFDKERPVLFLFHAVGVIQTVK